MLESRDEWIKKRAYAIWEEEGYPSGRDTVHWEQASSERIALEKSAGNGEKIDVTPKSKAQGGRCHGCGGQRHGDETGVEKGSQREDLT